MAHSHPDRSSPVTDRRATEATEAAVATLRQAGQRVTPARRAIIELLALTGDHLRVEDIVDRLCRPPANVHRATVYRTLDSLVHTGLVNHVHLAHGATTYHLAESAAPHHLHLVCRGCDAVVDAPADLLDDATARAADDLGFQLDAGHVALTGWCRACTSRR